MAHLAKVQNSANSDREPQSKLTQPILVLLIHPMANPQNRAKLGSKKPLNLTRKEYHVRNSEGNSAYHLVFNEEGGFSARYLRIFPHGHPLPMF